MNLNFEFVANHKSTFKKDTKASRKREFREKDKTNSMNKLQDTSNTILWHNQILRRH